MSIAEMAKHILLTGGNQTALNSLAIKQDEMREGKKKSSKFARTGGMTSKQIADSVFTNYEKGGPLEYQYRGNIVDTDPEGTLKDPVAGWEGWFELGAIDPSTHFDAQNPKSYTAMTDKHKKTQPTESELYAAGFESFDAFRSFVITQPGWENFDWDNLTGWGNQHQKAWEFIKTRRANYETTFDYENKLSLKNHEINLLNNQNIIGSNITEDIPEGKGKTASWFRRAGKQGLEMLPDLVSAGLQFLGPRKAMKLEARTMSSPNIPPMQGERFDYSSLYGRNAAALNATLNKVDRNLTGPEKMVMSEQLMNAGMEADLNVKTQETTANVPLINAEISENVKINAENAKNLLTARKFNAEQQSDIDFKKVEAMDLAGTRAAQVIQDALARVESKETARMLQGDTAILARQHFMRMHPGADMTTQQGMTDYLGFLDKWYPNEATRMRTTLGVEE